MGQTAALDIALVEGMGYTRNEAIDLVIHRALKDERDVADDRSGQAHADRRAYLDALRDICLAEAG